MPKDVQALAVENFKAWKQDPGSVKIKPLNCTANEVVSAEINYRYRALGVKGKDNQGQSVYVWFWMGSHEGYNKMIHSGLGLQGQIHTIRKKYLSNETEHQHGVKAKAA